MMYFNMKLSHFIAFISCWVMLLLGGCSPDSQKDIALFAPYIEANINKQSDDPYISSTLKPGDKFYEVLVQLQHGRHDLAETRLLGMLEKGDVQAKYWYARLIYTGGIKETPIALRLYQEAISHNNPYALLMLSPKGNGCAGYFGKRNCPIENFEKAMTLFKHRAEKGDVRAQYLLLRMYKPDGSEIKQLAYFMYDFKNDNYYLDHSDETRAFFIKEIIRFAEAHYYQPLMDYVNLIMPVPRYPKPYTAITPAHHQLALDLLTIAANHNYIPAIRRLNAIKKTAFAKDAPSYQRLLKVGGAGYFTTRLYRYQAEYTPQEQWVFARAYEILSGDFGLMLAVKDKPSKQEQAKLEVEAQALVDAMTSMVYIDEFTPRSRWVDR